MYYNPLTKELIDLNGKKVNPWKEKKRKSLLLSESYFRLQNTKFERVENCSDWLAFRLYTDETLKLDNANFCKDRLCPMCSWRRSLKIFGQVSKIMDHLDSIEKPNYLFLTLTIKNCFKEDLNDTIDSLIKGYNLLFKRKEVKKITKGTFRALEVTFNKKDGSFHPHLHVIIATNKSYFNDSNSYINHSRWKELWQKSLDLEYEPYIDIRKINKKKGSIAEVAKYSVKDSDFLEESNLEIRDMLVETFDFALKGRRLIGFNGLFRKAHKILNLDDALDGDLTNRNEEIRNDLDYVVLTFSWNVGIGNYTLYKE